MKARVTNILLIFAMLLTLVPIYPMQAEAAWGDNNNKQPNFIFPDVVSKVNYKYLTLQGTLSQVSPNGITYSVKNRSANIETTPTDRGITVSSDGTRITVANIELYDGDNTITFYGKQGTSDVVNTYEVTYISTPLLYNLQFTGGGKKLPIDPRNKTIVTRDFSTSNNFTIEGNAPNVKRVVVKTDSGSSSGIVSEDASSYFIVGKVNLKRGLNQLTFLLENDNQTVEVKREVVYYDGAGTFYDVKLELGTDAYDLSQNPIIKTSNSVTTRQNNSTFTGYVIIPREPRLTSFNPTSPGSTQIVQTEMSANGTYEPVPGSNFSYQYVSQTGEYTIYSFSFRAVGVSNAMFDDDQRVYTQLAAFNPVATYNSDPSNPTPNAVYDDPTNTEFGYMFQDVYAPFIEKLEYRFESSTTFNDLKDNVIINEKPFVIRMTVPYGTSTSGIKVESTNSYGNKSAVDIASITAVANGYDIRILELPFDGTQTLTIYYDANTYESVQINAAAGIVVTIDGLHDGLIFRYDPNQSNGRSGYAIRESSVTKYLIETVLKDFAGKIDNVEVTAGDFVADSKGNKAVMLKVNNNEVILKYDGNNRFVMDTNQGTLPSGLDYRGKVSQYFHDGQNSILFTYSKNNLVYTRTFTVTLYSNSVPQIPVEGTEIYPYNTTARKPDPRFVGSNGVYTTREKEMKISGTFDFIDLGDTVSEVNSTIDSISPSKYLLVIEGPEGFGTKTWDLAENTLLNGNSPYDNSKTDISGIDVYYDRNNKYFVFDIDKQQLPSDGSKVVFTFTVYNNGLTGGSRATYRLEVSSPGVTYNVLRPTYLQRTVNQNYIEVVIEAKNADKVVIGKTEAEKIEFDSDLDGTIDTSDAYKAIYFGLKAGSTTKIPITITRGSDVVSDTIEVFYAPANNVPGAQYMAPMNKLGKILDGKINLKFEKNTYLVRQDFSVPQNLRGQIFEGHNILFGIANSDDGVIDRYDYLEDRPRNFDETAQDLGRQIKNSFDSHFIKVSNVYWIDAGMADDPNTQEYDPYPYGMLPIMAIPDKMQPRLYNFDEVPSNRVLVPNKRGTLTLTYDGDVVQSAANTVTVMRYDPERYYWENLGGKVNTSKNTIEVPFDRFGYYVVAKLNDTFRDVVTHPYARNHLEAMFAKGVILPRSSVDFDPDSEITRGEFTALVVRALQLPLVTDVTKPSFDDVIMDYSATDLYDYRHIETAARLGIVRGTAPRIFTPTGKITREEAAVILARALELKLANTSTASKLALGKSFKDFNLISDYAAPSVYAITGQKLMQGSPVDPTDLKKGYVFEPTAKILRGDAAIMMARVMAKQKTISNVLEIDK